MQGRGHDQDLQLPAEAAEDQVREVEGRWKVRNYQEVLVVGPNGVPVHMQCVQARQLADKFFLIDFSLFLSVIEK